MFNVVVDDDDVMIDRFELKHWVSGKLLFIYKSKIEDEHTIDTHTSHSLHIERTIEIKLGVGETVDLIILIYDPSYLTNS